MTFKVGDLVTWKYSDDAYDIGVILGCPKIGSAWVKVQWSWAPKPGRVLRNKLRKVTDEGR